MTVTMGYGWKKGQPFTLELWRIGTCADGEPAYLAKDAAQAFLRMAEQAALDGVDLVSIINTAFRDNGHQERLYRRYIRLMAEWETGGRLGKKPAKAAPPGFSTHQSGLSVDLNRAQDDHTDNGIADGKTDEWIDAKAIRYGFVRDVASEPWHLTYVGEAPAFPPATV